MSTVDLIDVGGYRLAIACMGVGSPTVILEGGLGMWASRWEPVQRAVAAFTRACRFDRAGLGRSDRSPRPRTSQQMVEELHLLLENARVDPPYVFVGFSLGGLNAQLYALRYPAEVAGLVLLDPLLADLPKRIAALLPRQLVEPWISRFAYNAEGMTPDNFIESCAQVAVAGRLPDLPLVVVSAGRPLAVPAGLAWLPADRLFRMWQDAHRALARQSSRGRHIIAEHSSHSTLLYQQSGLVVDAIREVVEAVSGQPVR